MSLDHLFEEILVTEQKALEKRQFLHGVKSEIIRCNESLREISENLHQNKITLESKVKNFSEELFHLNLLKKQEETLKKQREEMTKENNHFCETLEKKKKKIVEEREKFVQEISEFNTEYDLLSNRIITIESKVKSKICDLDTEASHLKNGIEDELTTVIFNTKALEEEKVKVCQKPQTDPEFLRLKKELELYKEDDLESVCEALRAEIQYLQMKLSHGNHPQNSNSQLSERCAPDLSSEPDHIGKRRQP
ncbi:coiled-coil domain-containing protein 172 isoform X3 [Rhincodon typus]|uniref:coiled-coil domain-containing protein 172 isoform X3 n=1 Tax=Rhincodon typus TaxID=259920 RepID=UPI00203013BC|nr:coiled-coil domain-containing protein 172 isoform X3 [Rhincodon typus]